MKGAHEHYASRRQIAQRLVRQHESFLDLKPVAVYYLLGTALRLANEVPEGWTETTARTGAL